MVGRQRLRKALIAGLTALVGLGLYSYGIFSTRTLQDKDALWEEVEFEPGIGGVWLWPKTGEGKMPAVLFANGAAGTLEHNLPLALELVKHGVASFLFDFRGQGRSAGEFQPKEDLDAAILYFSSHERVDRERLGATGHSMGGRLLSGKAKAFKAMVIFGAIPRPDDSRILVAHSRFEFLFDPPDVQNIVIGRYSDHVTGPMDPELMQHALDWLGRHLGFQPVHPITEGRRGGSRLVALAGGALLVLACLFCVRQSQPTIVRDTVIPPIYLWITTLGTFTFPVILLRRTHPALLMFRTRRWKPVLLGSGFFLLVYLLSVGFASWSYFNVTIYGFKIGFFLVVAATFTTILWHDQNILHGAAIRDGEGRWRELWRAALAGAAGRWAAAMVLFLLVWIASGRVGIFVLLSALCFLVFWLEGLAAALSIRMRHPLAGATFLGLTWSWLATVLLPA